MLFKCVLFGNYKKEQRERVKRDELRRHSDFVSAHQQPAHLYDYNKEQVRLREERRHDYEEFRV